jgi:hypothetical protein
MNVTLHFGTSFRPTSHVFRREYLMSRFPFLKSPTALNHKSPKKLI